MRRDATYSRVEIIKECAYCEKECEYLGSVIGKPGEMKVWECPDHGKFYICQTLSRWGAQYTGMYNPSNPYRWRAK